MLGIIVSSGSLFSWYSHNWEVVFAFLNPKWFPYFPNLTKLLKVEKRTLKWLVYLLLYFHFWLALDYAGGKMASGVTSFSCTAFCSGCQDWEVTPNSGQPPIEAGPHLFSPSPAPPKCSGNLLESAFHWVPVPWRQPHVLLPRPSRPGGISSITLLRGIISVWFIYCLLSVCSCRSMLRHLWVRFSPCRNRGTESKYLCKDRRSPGLCRRFAGLIEAPAVLLPGKCSTWTVLSPP